MIDIKFYIRIRGMRILPGASEACNASSGTLMQLCLRRVSLRALGRDPAAKTTWTDVQHVMDFLTGVEFLREIEAANCV